MTLDEFINKMEAYLENFKKAYKKENSNDPENWPLILEESDWQEQFDLFCN